VFISDKQRILAMSIALTVALASPAAAQAPQSENFQIGSGGPLTAHALAEWVLQANPGLAAAAAAAEAAAHRIEPAGSLDDPVVSYAAAPSTIGSGRLNQRVEFSQQIPWPGTLRAREAAARHEATAAGNDLDALRLQVVAQAKSAAAEWRFVHEALEVQLETQGLLDDLVATARTRYAAGRAPRQDVLQAEVERAKLDNTGLRLRSQKSAIQARINALLNRPVHAPLPEAAAFSAARPVPEGPQLEDRALAHHPELQGLESRVLAQRARVDLAEKNFYPDFRLGVGYNSLWDDRDKRTIVGVSINIPFDRDKRKAELSRAQAEERRMEWVLMDRRADLLADIAQARAAAIETQQSVHLFNNQLVPLARDYLSAAIADYESGTGAFLNVISAEQRYLDTGLAHARARADHVRSIAELERVTGGDLFPQKQVQGGLER